MVSSFFYSEVAGQFDLSRQVLSIPLSLISLSVSQVFMQKISELKNSKKSIKIIFNKLFIFLVISAILFHLQLP
jgi:O-antigen/teichoic acid export membrane protein